MVDKYWVKFDGMCVSCMCHYDDKKCRLEDDDPECKLYVTKFIEITDDAECGKRIKSVQDASDKLEKKIAGKLKRQSTELQKSLRKFKI